MSKIRCINTSKERKRFNSILLFFCCSVQHCIPNKTEGIKSVWDKGWRSVKRLKYQELTLEIIWQSHLHTDTSDRIDQAECSRSASLYEMLLKFSWRRRRSSSTWEGSATSSWVSPCMCNSCRHCFDISSSCLIKLACHLQLMVFDE